MFDNIENLKIINVAHGTSKPYLKIENRKTASFNFRLSGCAHAYIDNKEIIAKSGELMFLPQGVSYEFRTFPENKSRFMNISVQLDIKNPSITAFSLENFPDSEYICNHLPDMWKYGTASEKYQVYSKLYNLISHLSAIEHTKYSDRKKYKIIEPAVSYLRSHIYDHSLKADKLHLLCGISNTYFRNIFSSNFGMSPQNYIVNKRISHAKSIIDSGDFDTITEVAASVGYTDPLYFSRAFKKKYGVSPINLSKE